MCETVMKEYKLKNLLVGIGELIEKSLQDFDPDERYEKMIIGLRDSLDIAKEEATQLRATIDILRASTEDDQLRINNYSDRVLQLEKMLSDSERRREVCEARVDNIVGDAAKVYGDLKDSIGSLKWYQFRKVYRVIKRNRNV